MAKSSASEAGLPMYCGEYVLTKVLGQGGMGRVYLAFNPSRPQNMGPYALKVSRERDGLTPELKAAILSEAKLFSRVRHDGIAASFEILEGAQETSIVMEYVGGVNLSTLRNFTSESGGMRIAFALYIAMRIAEGLAYLHGFSNAEKRDFATIFHGDLSPANVMVTFDGEIKLIDFGLARSEKRSHDAMKTDHANIAYCSPSRVRLKRVSETDDIFGLGIILWELLTGQRYYGRKTPEAIAEELLDFKAKDPIDFNSNVPDRVAEIVLRCLNCESLNGLTSMDDVYDALLQSIHALKLDFKVSQFRDFLQKSFAAEYAEQRADVERGRVLAEVFVKNNPRSAAEKARFAGGANFQTEGAKAEAASLEEKKSWIWDTRPDLVKWTLQLAILAYLLLAFQHYFLKTQLAERVARQAEDRLQPLLEPLLKFIPGHHEDSPPVVSTLYIRTEPSGAKIFIEGRVVGVTPTAVEIPTGAQTIELVAPGLPGFSLITNAGHAALFVNLKTGQHNFAD